MTWFVAVGIGIAAMAGISFIVSLVSARVDRARPSLPLVMLVVALVLLVGVGVWAQSIATPPARGNPPTVDAKAGAGGWGPERPTYTMEHPPKQPTLNSITDHSGWGDERNFVQVRDLTSNSRYTEMLEACPSDIVEVLVGVHNDTSENSGDAGTITGLRLIGEVDRNLSHTDVTMTLESTNAGKVWDWASLTCAGRSVNLIYREGSGRQVWDNNAGRPLLGDPFSDPVIFGRDRDDGKFPCVGNWFGYIIFQFEVV